MTIYNLHILDIKYKTDIFHWCLKLTTFSELNNQASFPIIIEPADIS